MDDIFGNAKSWNEYLNLLNEYDLLQKSATADIDLPFLDCDAVLNRVMDTQPTCCKSLLNPAALHVSSTLTNITSEIPSSSSQKIESHAMSQVLCYPSQVSLEMIDLGQSSEAVFAAANRGLSQADRNYRGKRLTHMLECSQSFKQPNSIEVIPSSVTVTAPSTAKISPVPCREVSFIINETAEIQELTATNTLGVNAVQHKHRHRKRKSCVRRSDVRRCKMEKRLLKMLTKLERENNSLKRICADLQNFSSHDQATWDTQRKLMHNIFCSRQAFIVTDPNIADNGIVYASQAFLQMTGYAREHILGRSCRLLQGPRTCPNKIDQLRKAVGQGKEWVGTILNYKADNTPFWNRLYVAALRNKEHRIVNYVGLAVEVELPDSGDPEYAQALVDVVRRELARR